MLGILKNRPWKNLISNMSSPVSLPLLVLFTLYAILLPFLVVIKNVYGISFSSTDHILNIISLLIIFFIPRYLRSGKHLLSLRSKYNNGVIKIFYHFILKMGGVFAVVFIAYFAILISMLILQEIAGIKQSQDIPDLTHLTFFNVAYQSFSAGLSEEVWRIVTFILILGMIKNISSTHWNNDIVKITALILTVIVTSFAFGWLHTFGYSDSYFSIPIIIQIGVVGIILSGVILITRRIWYAVFFHFLFDFISISAHANEITSEANLTKFIEDYGVWIGVTGFGITLGFICLVLSIYLLKFSKGAENQ